MKFNKRRHEIDTKCKPRNYKFMNKRYEIYKDE